MGESSAHSVALKVGSFVALTLTTTNPWLVLGVVSVVCVTAVAVAAVTSNGNQKS